MEEEFGPERSLINETDAEWRKREINLKQLFSSFLSQISSKTDLTKISLPSVLCHPFSMLELISHRELLLFHILFELDGVNDPLQRFIIVVKWYIALLRTETMEKKPFNPVIGETHLCWVANTNSDSITEFISEQVSHHPPVSAFLIRNKDKNLRIEGAVSFGVHLATNSASVSTSSAVLMTTDKDSYELSKCVPDLTVCNTIMPGKKYIMWTGEVKLVCPETGYYAVLKTEEKSGKVNQIIGQILHRDEPKPIYKLEGVCGKITQYWPANSPKEKKVLLDHSQLQEAFINYLPRHLRSSLDSMKLWVPVVDAILKNDMATADIEKKKIEADQRIRQAKKFEDGLGSEGTYFMKNPVSGNWEFKDNMDLTEFMNLGKPADVLGLPPSEPINVPAPLTIEPVAASPSLSVSPIDVPIPQSAPVLVEPEKEPLPVTAAVKTDIPPTVTSTNTTTPISANPPSPQVTPNVPTNVPTVPAVDQEVKVTPEIDATTTNNLTNTTNPPVANIANNTQPQPQPQPQANPINTQAPTNITTQVPTTNITAAVPTTTVPPSLQSQASNISLQPPQIPANPDAMNEDKSENTDDDEDKMEDGKKRKSATKPDEEKDIQAKKKEFKKVKKETIQKAKELAKQNQSIGLIPEKDILKVGTLKIRNSLKKWNPRWAVLVPGRLIYFNDKNEFIKENCRGIVLLSGCLAIERPSKKEGFCIKIYNVHKYPIYSRQDLRGKPINKAIGALSDSCLLRIKSSEEGKEWLKALIKAIPDLEMNKSVMPTVVEDSESSEGVDGEESDEVIEHLPPEEVLKQGSQPKQSPSKSVLERAKSEKPKIQKKILVESKPSRNLLEPKDKKVYSPRASPRNSLKFTDKSALPPPVPFENPLELENDSSEILDVPADQIVSKIQDTVTSLKELVIISEENAEATKNELATAITETSAKVKHDLQQVIDAHYQRNNAQIKELENRIKGLSVELQTVSRQLAYSIRNAAVPPKKPELSKNQKKIQQLRENANLILLVLVLYIIFFGL